MPPYKKGARFLILCSARLYFSRCYLGCFETTVPTTTHEPPSPDEKSIMFVMGLQLAAMSLGNGKVRLAKDMMRRSIHAVPQPKR